MKFRDRSTGLILEPSSKLVEGSYSAQPDRYEKIEPKKKKTTPKK